MELQPGLSNGRLARVVRLDPGVPLPGRSVGVVLGHHWSEGSCWLWLELTPTGLH